MTYARKTLVSLNDTPYYHLIARCVRRAWLWGFDEYAGRDDSHRKEWVLTRMHRLSLVFAIDICAYAIMFESLSPGRACGPVKGAVMVAVRRRRALVGHL